MFSVVDWIEDVAATAARPAVSGLGDRRVLYTQPAAGGGSGMAGYWLVSAATRYIGGTREVSIHLYTRIKVLCLIYCYILYCYI